MITKVKIRFDKWHHSTDRAHLLTYRGKKVWLAKKVCWGLEVAGNDLHAWATVPPFIFKDLTGHDIDDVVKDYGTHGLREHFDAVPQTIIEHHVPERKEPVESNTIKELKK